LRCVCVLFILGRIVAGTPGKYPKENILHKEHGESLKSRQTEDGNLPTPSICTLINRFS